MTPPTFDLGIARLRPLQPGDATALHEGFADPELMLYWARPPHESLADTEADIAWWLESNGDAAWAIEMGGQVVGRIGLYQIRDGVREVGVFLLRPAHGKGVALAAVKAIVADGFARLKLHRIVADIDPANIASIRLFEKAGFVFEGRLKGNWRTHTGIQDSLIYARTSY